MQLTRRLAPRPRGYERCGPSPRPLTTPVREGIHAASSTDGRAPGGRDKASPHLLPLARVGTVPPRRGIPRTGTATAPQPRDVPVAPGRGGGAPRPARALPRRQRPDDLRARGEDRHRPPRDAARLPRDRGVPRALAEVGTGSRPSLDLDPLFRQREVDDLVPARGDLLRHRLLVRAVLPRRLRRRLVARLGRDALEQLVARDLHVLGREAVAGVA